MHKKFEINRTKIKGGYQLGRKVVTHNSKSDLHLCIKRKCVCLIFLNSYFSRHETLNHAIDKPHECNLCPYTKKFQLSSSLKRHMKIFHGQDNDVDYPTQEKDRILMLPNPEISIHE